MTTEAELAYLARAYLDAKRTWLEMLDGDFWLLEPFDALVQAEDRLIAAIMARHGTKPQPPDAESRSVPAVAVYIRDLGLTFAVAPDTLGPDEQILVVLPDANTITIGGGGHDRPAD